MSTGHTGSSQIVVNANGSVSVLLAGNDQRKLFVLIEVNKAAQQQNLPAVFQRELKFVVDISGSTSEPAAPGSRESKLDVMKAGLIQVIEQMPPQDLISVTTFEDTMSRVVRTESVKLQRTSAIQKIQSLSPQGMTHLSGALAHGVKSKKPGVITRASLMTDGHINKGGPQERPNCVKTMKDASAVPTWIIGIGVDYDPVFLQELADAGPAGSFYRHVSNAYELEQVLNEQLLQLTTMGDITDVVIEVQSLSGAKVVKATRLEPTHADIPVSHGSARYNHGDLDAFGQRILLEVEVPAQSLFIQAGNQDDDHDLVEYTISYKANGQAQAPIVGTVGVRITGDEDYAKQAQLNMPVMTTVYTVNGQRLTLAGDYQQASTWFTRAGNSTVASGLKTLASSGLDENEERTLKTMVNLSGRNPLNTLSS